MAYNFLVVDDSKIVRAVLVKTLGLCQLEIGKVHEASNGLEALDILGDNWVDVVLTDINMPVMDGLEFVKTMKESGYMASIPVVVISIEGSQSRIEALKQIGIRDFIRKPFTPEQVRSVLVQHLGKGKDHVDKILKQVIAQIFEGWATIFADEATNAASLGNVPLYHVHIGFNGPHAGKINLWVSEPLSQSLVVNVKGVESGGTVSDADKKDAIRELANITCGHFLSTFYGEQTIFQFSVPEVSQRTVTEFDGKDKTVMSFEGQPLLADISIQK